MTYGNTSDKKNALKGHHGVVEVRVFWILVHQSETDFSRSPMSSKIFLPMVTAGHLIDRKKNLTNLKTAFSSMKSSCNISEDSLQMKHVKLSFDSHGREV